MESIQFLEQHIIHFVQLLRRLLRWRTRDPAPTRCAILELPNEILLRILFFLPQHSQMLISQTCRGFHVVTQRYFPAGYRPDTFEGQLLYLSHRARSLPDRWVCTKCLKLHRINVRDTPGDSLYSFCDAQVRDGPDYYGQYGFHLTHKHLQLTLKYTRLGEMDPKYESYLKSLIAPYHTYIKPNDLDISRVKRQYSVYPKVINGRYLLHTRWRYQKADGSISTESMGYLSICAHQKGHSPINNSIWFNLGNISPVARAESDERVACGPWDGLHTIIEKAFQSPHTEFCGHCTYCNTDFSVKASQKEVTVSTWQDFGIESTPFSLEWSTMVFRHRGVFYHPGSVRKLYG
ncbi:hypothetical protein V8C35DRAFT_331609 [Trichoderma chlorosporum]